MSAKYVSILGGRYITDGHIVKNAGPQSINPSPIAQSVVGGQVGYSLKYNKRRVFYSVALIQAMYEQEVGKPVEHEKTFEFTIGWKFIVIASLLTIMLNLTTCSILVTTHDEEQDAQPTYQHTKETI